MIKCADINTSIENNPNSVNASIHIILLFNLHGLFIVFLYLILKKKTISTHVILITPSPI
jgi:hypothetical protein